MSPGMRVHHHSLVQDGLLNKGKGEVVHTSNPNTWGGSEFGGTAWFMSSRTVSGYTKEPCLKTGRGERQGKVKQSDLCFNDYFG